MKASSKIWRETLKLAEAGVKPTEWPHELRPNTDGATLERLGFYRLPRKEPKLNAQGQKNGQWKTVDYEPVAVTVIGGNLAILVGDQIVQSRGEKDSGFLVHPISEDLWRAVKERNEPWPDAVPAADREVTKSDNAEPEQPLDVQHATAVDNAIAAAPKTVASEDDAAKALGSKNRIAELRLAADKAGKSVYEPIYRTYTAEQKKWSPIVKSAKDAEDLIQKMILIFREAERQRLAKEADEAAAKLDIAATPEPIAAPAPIVASYGTRKLKEELKKFVIIDDISVVFTNFKTNTEVVALLTKLAQSEIDAGRNVPGSHYREGLI